MRTALSGLTTRGRSFLAAGIAAAMCAVVLGQRDLLRVGFLLAAMPLVAVLVVARTRHLVTSTRLLEPGRVAAGAEAQVRLRVDNVSRIPTGLLMLEDHVPYVLGSRPRFVLDRIEPHGHRQVAYRVRSDLRGKFTVGPLRLRLADPFGMCELTRSFAARDLLVVTPVVQQLPAVDLGGEWTGYGDGNARSLAAAGEEDVVPREYRHGDDVRRVHWRSTARRGELMVRREEQSWQNQATLLLDTRPTAHRGEGPSSSFEWAVSAAASVGVHLCRRGYTTHLIAADGRQLAGTPENLRVAPAETESFLLDALAVVETGTAESLDGAELALRRPGAEGMAVAVLANLTEDDTRRLARSRGTAGRGLAIVLNTAAWDSARVPGVLPHDTAVGLLRQAGWRVLSASATTRLPDLWRGAGRSSNASPYTAPLGGTLSGSEFGR
ncbi:DUF58 domain-containing protein [Yinghuangia sp. ASG 101]|uniref:DUF58 domain-containing protein n=1 Tax=Yinghuangia sp. ASG 101 TaxID=2896848 RepID=UPI001E2A3A1C|nr:DUF58 domain-containing protein [Yinghuangia sp. ASG 101]UGQ10051.1 DUF58 domain-containing protein [Yinghuangia sp. ASG 101]